MDWEGQKDPIRKGIGEILEDAGPYGRSARWMRRKLSIRFKEIRVTVQRVAQLCASMDGIEKHTNRRWRMTSTVPEGR